MGKTAKERTFHLTPGSLHQRGKGIGCELQGLGIPQPIEIRFEFIRVKGPVGKKIKIDGLPMREAQSYGGAAIEDEIPPDGRQLWPKPLLRFG